MNEIDRDLAGARRPPRGPSPTAAPPGRDAPRPRGCWTWPTPRSTRRSGPLTVAAHRPRPGARGLPRAPVDAVLEASPRDVSPRVLEAPARLDDARRELDEYFEGACAASDRDRLVARARLLPQVLRATARIGYGKVRTYGEVAGEAGSPRAVRAAGNGLGLQPDAGGGAVPPRGAHRRRARRLHRRASSARSSCWARGRGLRARLEALEHRPTTSSASGPAGRPATEPLASVTSTRPSSLATAAPDLERDRAVPARQGARGQVAQQAAERAAGLGCRGSRPAPRAWLPLTRSSS